MVRLAALLDVRYVLLVLAVALAVPVGAFAVAPAGGETISPVAFGDTLKTGLTGVEVRQAAAAGHEIPRAQVFYSQYRYVVGYYTTGALLDALGPDGHVASFGRPLAVFVTDYSGTDPVLTDDGFVTLGTSVARGWTRASEAHFVVDGAARRPSGPAVLGFDDRAAARDFADQTDGRAVDWATLQREGTPGEANQTAALERAVADQRAWADRTVDARQRLLDRPVSVTVGEDAPTLAAAVAQAPPNTTVRVPAGTYETNLTVEKPLTIRGVGNATHLRGPGTGTVLTLRAPGSAVADVRITGVGPEDLGTGSDEGGGWDERVRLVYGRGDAGVRLDAAPRSLVANVSLETDANGVVLLNSTASVVTDVTVRGTADWQDGSMGVLPMYSRVVVQDSTMVGGRDGVYTHYSDGLVVRDNRMADGRYGIHEMYTSDALFRNNTVRDADVGVILMTRPTGNLVVGNDVRGSDAGLVTVGSNSYVARNVVAGNGRGLSIGTDRSVVRENTVVHNRVGLRSDTLMPTNRVVANDVVGNAETVDMGRGPLELWAADDRGNYWGPVPGIDRDGDGVVDRPYRPASALDAGASRSGGAAVLTRSPAVVTLRQFQRSVPGMRPSGLVDPAPLARPVRPDVLARVRNATAAPGAEGST